MTRRGRKMGRGEIVAFQERSRNCGGGADESEHRREPGTNQWGPGVKQNSKFGIINALRKPKLGDALAPLRDFAGTAGSQRPHQEENIVVVKLLGNLELFVAVARALSFSQAARSLGLPTSTLSRHIAEFERALGLPLFVRTTRRVELTEAAQRLLARCESIVEAAREARDEALGVAAHPSGTLRISLEADVGTTLISPSVAELCQKYPDIRVDLDLSPRRVDLIGEGFDLAVRLGALPDSSLVARQITSLSVGLYAAPGYLKRHGTPRTPDDLKSHARLHLLHANDSGDWHLSSGRRKVVVERRGASVSANNMTMLRSLLRLGLGIGVMDQVMGAEELRSHSLVRVLPAWTLPPVPVSILTPGRLLPAKTRVLIAILLKRLAGVAARGA